MQSMLLFSIGSNLVILICYLLNLTSILDPYPAHVLAYGADKSIRFKSGPTLNLGAPNPFDPRFRRYLTEGGEWQGNVVVVVVVVVVIVIVVYLPLLISKLICVWLKFVAGDNW